ncbi:hypothetical protein [Sessilibacter sp. MAH4]
MKLIFTKGADKYDQLVIHRDDTSPQIIDCPKQGIIPHDMVHYAVENTLNKRGFVVQAIENELPDSLTEYDDESNGVERLVEVFQADGWSGWSSEPATLLDLYQVTCNARRCEPLNLQEHDIEAVRQNILQLTQLWQPIAVGESLELTMET